MLQSNAFSKHINQLQHATATVDSKLMKPKLFMQKPLHFYQNK
jgi:hypothetical protein